MAIDFKFKQDEFGNWDINFAGGDIETTQGLDSAIYLSILSENRASASQIKDARLRRGHFTNEFNNIQNSEVGSLVWYYSGQVVNTQSNASLIQDAIADSLSWILDQGIASDLEVSVEKKGSGLNIDIELISELTPENKYYNLFFNTVN